MPARISDKMPEYISDRMSGGMPDTMSEYMSDRLPDRIPHRMPGRMPDRMSDWIPEYISEHISGYNVPQWGSHQVKSFVCYDHPGKDSNLRVSHQAWMMVACRTGGKWTLALKTFVWCAALGVANSSGLPSVSQSQRFDQAHCKSEARVISCEGPKQQSRRRTTWVATFWLPTTKVLPTTHYLLPTTRYYKLSTTCNYKVSIYYPLPSTHYLLPTGDYLLPIADHLLHTAYLETSVAFLRSSAVAMLDGSRKGGTTTHGPMQWQSL